MAFRPNMVAIMKFLVDFLLIAGINRIFSHRVKPLRSSVAAAIGAAYAAGCVLPDFAFLGQLHWQIVVSSFICMVAFGLESSTIWKGILLVLLRLAIGGIALGFGKGGFWTVLMAALSICLMCILGMNGSGGQKYLPVCMTHCGKTIQLTALADTGNMLRDPVSGLPVLVVDAGVAWELLRISKRELLHPVEALATAGCPGLRLIPYSAVGQERGLLLGLRVDRLQLNGEEQNMVVAFAPHSIGQNGKYRALAGGMFV